MKALTDRSVIIAVEKAARRKGLLPIFWNGKITGYYTPSEAEWALLDSCGKTEK